MQLDFEQLGKNIKKELEKRNWEQQELAILVRIDQPRISRYLSGERKIPLGIAMDIADAFGMPVEKLAENARG